MKEEELNEKIKWSNLLLALGIAYVGVSKFREYNKIKDIYQVVNSSESMPSAEESKWIEDIRKEVIQEIKSSDLFKKFDKQYIIDSIQKINFRIVDSKISFSQHASACYIYIKPLKSKYKYLLQSEIPSSDNFIIISRKGMKDSSYASVVVHEIYHYFDRLLVGGSDQYSNVNKISKFLDKDLDDEKYIKKKIGSLMLFSNHEGDGEKEIIDLIYNDYMDNKKYYESEAELFVRYKTLKHDMVKSGILSSINQIPTLEDFANYLYKLDTGDRGVELFTLLSIDLKKIKELDSLI